MRYVGWYPRRRGILEHLDRGTISLLDAAVHDFLCLTADHRTGITWASAEKIHVLAGAGISLRAIQRSLAKLETLGWIKRFRVHGKRGNYATLIGRYFVRDASLKWWSVSLARTNDWRDVQFDAVTDPSFVGNGGGKGGDAEDGTEASRIQESRTKNRDGRPDALTDAGDVTTERVCCLKAKNPWKFCRLDEEKIPVKFKKGRFASLFQEKFEELKDSHQDGENCDCFPDDFLGSVRDACKRDGVLYPPALLKRQVEIEKQGAAG